MGTSQTGIQLGRSNETPNSTRFAAPRSPANAATMRRASSSRSGNRGVPVLWPLYQKMKHAPVTPDLNAIWRSLGVDDGDMYAAARVSFADDASAELAAMPYATPFAWGPCGLVLPRYPGMRVLLEHRNGSSSDPIDVGALWDWGRAPDSQAGDFWLILPAAIPPDQRTSLKSDDTPANPVGKATNDLIDADGNRVIEVGTLTIRVGTDTLKDAGTRPASEASTVHIQHAKGSKITIDQDGNVTVHSAADLTLSAIGKMTLDASSVAVTVSSTMDVSKK